MNDRHAVDDRRPAIERLAILGEALGAVGTLALAVAAVLSARPGRLAVGLVIGVALAWSTTPLLADLTARRFGPSRQQRRLRASPGSSAGTLTTVVRLGDEPSEIARAAVLVALEGGEVALLARDDHDLPDDLSRLAPVHRGSTPQDALADALQHVTTDAVLLVSGRATPRLDACRSAATHLGGAVAWVTGRTEPFSSDGFVPDGRDAVGSRLRTRARDAGLDLWEPDATLVCTRTLRAHPPEPDRPWGTWLRERRAEGLVGVTVSETLSYRSAPADAETFWPDAIARHRAAASDLARGTSTGPPVGRLLAALLLARELYALPLLGWLVLPLLLGASGEFPFTLSAPGATVLAAVLLALRWAGLRLSVGLPLSAADDVLSALHHVPGSLAAVPATVTNRLRPLRASVPTRPLVWSALVLTLLAGASLVDRDPGAPASKLSVGTALVTLALLWAFTMRSLIRRSWSRRSARIPIGLDVGVAGIRGRTLDCSPTGLAVSGPFDDLDAAPGTPLQLRVELDDGRPVDLRATVAGRRRRGDSVLLGLTLSADDASLGPWLTQVVRAAGRADARDHGAARQLPITSPGERPRWRSRAIRIADRVVHASAALASAALVATLALVVLGFQPFVIRSASMVPTLGIGDVVLSEQVRASELEAGDVVTQPDHLGPAEAMTHRVIGLHPTDESLVVETRGDANEQSERWTVGSDELVGRVRWSIPRVGGVVSGLRTSGVQLALALGVVGVIAVTTVRPRGRQDSRPTEPAAPA